MTVRLHIAPDWSRPMFKVHRCYNGVCLRVGRREVVFQRGH